ncbi:GNAT family N-acetyltransferase [Arcanobacterium canis]
MGQLVLRELTNRDELAARNAHRIMSQENFDFLLGDSSLPWPEFLTQVAQTKIGENLPSGYVPATFMGAFYNGELIGRVSIRHELNGYLLAFAGHIGYAVLPEHRRRGYGTNMLALAVDYCARELGHQRVLVTCAESNLASRRVIEANGGVLENTSDLEGEKIRRYWVETVSSPRPQ